MFINNTFYWSTMVHDVNLLVTQSKFIVSKLNESITSTNICSSYLFSPKIKNVIFNTLSKEKKDQLKIVLEKIGSLYKLNTSILNEAYGYYQLITSSKTVFTQKRYYSLSTKFAYNSVEYSKEICSFILELRNYLTQLYGNNSPIIMQELFHRIKKLFERIETLQKESTICFADIQGRIQIQLKVINEYKEFKNRMMNESQLLTGDVLLSFKTKDFLKKNLVKARIGAIITHSQITHVMLCIKPNLSAAKVIESVPGGLSISKVDIIPDEILIVLRPKISFSQRAMLLQCIRKYYSQKPSYAYWKIVFGVPTLLFTDFVNLLSLGYVHVPNFYAVHTNKIYCSEFLDKVFKDAKIMLTPKSRYSNVVSPADIAVSPLMDFIGFIFEDSQKSEDVILKLLSDVEI